jgi:hypothetical protein
MGLNHLLPRMDYALVKRVVEKEGIEEHSRVFKAASEKEGSGSDSSNGDQTVSYIPENPQF